MTKIGNKMVKCAKCGKESKQTIVYSVNSFLGTEEEIEKLINKKQKCPYCEYEAQDISVKVNNNFLKKIINCFRKK